MAIIREEEPGKFEVAKTIKTQVSAKTIALDPKTHRLYLSAATPDTAPAAKPATKAPAADTFQARSSCWWSASDCFRVSAWVGSTLFS